jgi:SAM-dependent methyltransferase
VRTPETTRQAQMSKVFGYLKGLHATHLVDIGTHLGLFRQLAAAPQGLLPEALAAQAGLHPPYVRIWCEAACAVEVLDFDPSTGYRLAPYMDEILGRPEATFYLGLFPQVHLLLARDYASYPDLFRSGGVYPYQAHDRRFLHGVAEATQALPRMFLDAVLPKLPALAARLEAGATVLDVGCGGGHALIEFATRYPRTRVVGIDVEPTSVAIAQDLILARGLSDRVEAHLTDAVELPATHDRVYDLVMSFLVLHEIRPDHKAAALRRCAEALRPGGTLLLFDERYPSHPAELRDPVQIYAVMAQWYELTWGNIVNTREEIHALLAEQGLRVVEETALSRFYIVAARRS